MNIEVNPPRECFLSPSPSSNSLREISVNFAASYIDYAECIPSQSAKLIWAEQIERGSLKNLLFSMLL